jgi:hypothetical protein
MQFPSAPAVVTRPQTYEPFRFFVKLGYAVKGCVYGILGVLALEVVLGDGGRLAGEKEAMRHVARQSFGDAALVVIAAGLFFYASWRLIEAVFDPYHVGNSLKGAAQRAAALVSAIGNGFAALTAVQLARGAHDSGKNPKTLAALALREEWGAAALVVVGCCLAGAGVVHLYEAVTARFCDHLDLSRSSRGWRAYVVLSGRAGYVARGCLFVIIGLAAVRAGHHLDAQEVKGVGEALASLTRQPFGPGLLAAAAAGLLAYALHLVTTAPIRKLGD